MYTDDHIKKIVRFLRKPAKPRPIQDIEDVKKTPNDVLMSYWLNSLDLKGPLPANMNSLSKLEKCLADPQFFTQPGEPEPFLEDGLQKDSPAYCFEASLGVRSTKTVKALGSDELLIGDKEPKQFEYYGGLVIPYNLLCKEQSANVSIHLFGYTNTAFDQEIYIRESSLRFYQAMAKNTFYSQEFETVGRFRSPWGHLAVTLAHEYCERELYRKNELPDDFMERELLVEKHARALLQAQFVKPKYYFQFHALRSNRDERGANVSREIFNLDFNTLFP